MNPHLIPEMEMQINRLQQDVAYLAGELVELDKTRHPLYEARLAIRQLAAGAALAKLTDSLATLRRMQDEDKGQPCKP